MIRLNQKESERGQIRTEAEENCSPPGHRPFPTTAPIFHLVRAVWTEGKQLSALEVVDIGCYDS